ncbi:hypothetical protein PAMH19_4139 [Pseudomonas aeruginosa]|nr:hypothetical protein PAMH19_4139 [Pseudomonas aeruginosa]
MLTFIMSLGLNEAPIKAQSCFLIEQVSRMDILI